MTLLELLTIRGIRFLRQANDPDEIWLACPFCHDSRFRLGLNTRTGWAHCFSGVCGYKSRKAIGPVLRALDLGDAKVIGESKGPAEKKVLKVRLPEDFTPLEGVRKKDRPLVDGLNYLLRRGISLEQVGRYHFGGSLVGRFAYRIIMPVVHRSKLIMLVCRDWTGQQKPKYLNSSGDKLVWNCRRARKTPLVLAEGIFKALAVEAYTNYPAGALLGHSITDLMLKQVLEGGHKQVVVLPDPDGVGIRGALDVAERLQSSGIEVLLPAQIPTLQADELPGSVLKEHLAQLKSLDFQTRLRYLAEANKRCEA